MIILNSYHSRLTANVRYTPEQQDDILVTAGRGGIFHGPSSPAPAIMQGKSFRVMVNAAFFTVFIYIY